MLPRTLLDRIWKSHEIVTRPDGTSLLYIDRHLVHDACGQAFDRINEEVREVRRPDLTLGMADHYAATGVSQSSYGERQQRMVQQLSSNARRWKFQSHGQGSAFQGIVHVAGPELGFTLPGTTVACGDSHTSTNGALGALALGVGSSEVAHVLATQTLWQKKPKTMLVRVDGRFGRGVSAKDLILAFISRFGTSIGLGHVIEFGGTSIQSLSMEGRMTLCNMAIEAGARAGIVGPDETTFGWLMKRPLAPTGIMWDKALNDWCRLASDVDAVFDREISFDGSEVAPMVSWGTSPEDSLPIDSQVPDPAEFGELNKRESVARTLDYMGLHPGQRIIGLNIDRVFIGSCANSRIEDLRIAAAVIRGRRCKVPTAIVPGSAQVKSLAETEGLDRIFLEAGCEWGKPGCSMCVGINGDIVPPGQRCASTSNRNFAGRQGPQSRTHLMSPAMAAAAATEGRLVDIRYFDSRSHARTV